MRIYGAIGILTMSSILAAQPIAFVARSRTLVGANPVSLAIGAFTGDATTDLVVADQGAAMLTVLRGLGNGFFQPLTNPPTGISPHAVAAGDFNRDGRLDLAVANFASNSVSVLLGTGAGTFRTVANLAARGPTGIAVGDFNADGKLDLAVTETNSNTVAIFLGIGAGLFRAVLTVPVGERPVSVAIGDFNGDGKLDLAVVNRNSNNVSILLGIGNGTFLGAVNFAAGQLPVYVTAADLNGDGKPDLAVANATGFSAGTISVLLSAGRGLFLPPLTFTVGTNPSFVTAADFNLDGVLDLAVANTDSSTISVLQGIGNGVFLPQHVFEVDSGPSWIGVADFNTDGRPDLVVANRFSNTVETLINRSGIAGLTVSAIVNAGSLQSGPVAPGEMVTIFGSGLGASPLTSFPLDSSGHVSTALGQNRVLFDGIAAPIISIDAGKVTAMVPYRVAGGSSTELVVENNETVSPVMMIPVSDSAPALFTADGSGNGPGAIRNEDGSLNSASNPAARGSIIILYGTGLGQTDPAGLDGLLATEALPQPVLPVSATIDGQAAQVLYAGAAPGQVAGIAQVNLRVPNGIRSGSAPVVLRVGDGVSQPGVTLSVQ